MFRAYREQRDLLFDHNFQAYNRTPCIYMPHVKECIFAEKKRISARARARRIRT